MHSELWQQFVGSTIDGRYRLDRLLGAGAHGAAFAAMHLTEGGGGVPVAIKLMLRDPIKADQQLKELTSYAGLSCPTLIRSFVPGACDLNGVRLIYLPGELADASLSSRLPADPLSLDECRDIGLCIASALSYLHGLPTPLVHRDIKPANVVITGGRWKVADFSLLKAVSGKEGTHTRSFVGTAEYAPPEAFDGLVVPAWDIWSLGITLHEAATGSLPFRGDTPQQMMRSICTDLPSISPSIDANLSAIIAACLTKTHQDRPSAEAALEMLEQLDSGMANWRYEQEETPQQRRRQAGVEDHPTPILEEVYIEPTEISTVASADGIEGTYPLSEALKRTLTGGHIRLMPGTYSGGISLSRSVILFCEAHDDGPQATIEAVGAPAITVTANDVRLSGLNLVSKADTQQSKHDTVTATGAARLQIDGCALSGGSLAALGIRGEKSSVSLISSVLKGGRTATIEMETGTVLEAAQCHILESGGSGIHAATGAKLSLQDCDIYHSHDAGVILDKGARAEIVATGVYANEGSGITLTDGCDIKVTGTAIYDNRQTGISMRGRCQAELESCELTRNVLTGAAMAGGALARFTECNIHDSRSNGLSISDASRCFLKSCQVATNGFAGVKVTHGGELTAEQTGFKDGKRSGLDVQDGAKAILEECTFTQNAQASLLIEEGGHVEARACSFSEGVENGVTCSGSAAFTSCTFSENAGAGSNVLRGGAPTFNGCTFDSNHHAAIVITEGAEAVVENCTLLNSVLPAVAVGQGSKILLSGTTLQGGEQTGATLWDQSRAIIDNCTITGFKQDAVRLMTGSGASISNSRLVGCGEFAIRATAGSSGDVSHCDLSGCAMGAGHVEAGCTFTSASNKIA